MKISDIKNSHKAFIRKLIESHDDECYTIREIINLCEKSGFNRVSDTMVRTVLNRCAESIKHESRVWWGNKNAVAKVREEQ